MPSPRLRPSSPLSPQVDAAGRHDYLQPPSSRSFKPRVSTQQRRYNAGQLMLPTLPRYHPANFANASSSQHSSVANTPGSSPTTPQMPYSPNMQQKMYNDAQKQLYLSQRETMAGRNAAHPREKPTSPRLLPLGSPGPVTPLELEESDDYLAAGDRSSARDADTRPTEQLVEQLMQDTKSSPWPVCSSGPT